ncbi:MAG: hypothetical protein AAGA33_13765 [Pseudomonadota bacterium]
MNYWQSLLLVALLPLASCTEDKPLIDIEPFPRGPLAVGSTNMEVADAFAGVGDDVMHNILIGQPGEDGPFVSDIMRYPDSAWVVNVDVPKDPAVYGPTAGTRVPVSLFITYPSAAIDTPAGYAFPYQDAQNGEFEHMLAAGEAPAFADADTRYPLIIQAHGYSAHGIYDVGHAHKLSRHGYIVAVLFYGDLRSATPNTINHHTAFLRTLMTRAALDAILDSAAFGDRIDTDNIGISGHSFGGYTGLAIAGARYLDNAATVHDERIKASVIAAPWVGHVQDGEDFFAFGDQNRGLERVSSPVLSFFGTRDEATTAEFILPAMRHLSGPTYVVELVDQPHVFDAGSWEDRDNWELLFFNAYLKSDDAALAALAAGRSMKGGNIDRQRFEFQQLPASSAAP